MAANDSKETEKLEESVITEASGGMLDTVNRKPLAPLMDAPAPKTEGGGWLAFGGAAFGLLWFGGAAAYLAGYTDLTALSPAQLAGLSVFAAAPALLFVLAGLLGREVSRAGSRARRLDAAVLRLATPTEHAEEDASRLADAITMQVDRVNKAMESALARLAAMEEVITHHAESLEDGSTRARERAEQLTRELREERLRLNDVSEGLDDKAAMIAAAIQDQSKMVAAAAELADAKAAAGERLIKSGAERLSAAGQAAEEAGDRVALSLDARATELRDFSDMLRNRTDGLEEAYLKHRDRLQDVTETLRKEQEKIGAALDFHKAELETMTRKARDGAEILESTAKNSGEVFLDAVDKALGQAKDLANSLSERSEEAARAQERALDRMRDAARAAREAAEEAGESLKKQADDAEAALERVSESGFEVARRSDEAYQARLREAEDLTARAEKAAEEAAEAVRKQLSETLDAARRESRRIEDELSGLRSKLEDAPDAARDAAKAMQRTLEDGLAQLNETAQTASDQARDIDALFQSRIRQNYELLSDFILRMGAVAGGHKPLDLNINELPDPLSARRKDEDAPRKDGIDKKPTSKRLESEKRDEDWEAAKVEERKAERARRKGETKPALRSIEPDRSREDEESEEADFVDDEDDPVRDSIRDGVAKARKEASWRWRDLLANMDSDSGDTPPANKNGDKRNRGGRDN